jgi:hypothetical protein
MRKGKNIISTACLEFDFLSRDILSSKTSILSFYQQQNDKKTLFNKCRQWEKKKMRLLFKLTSLFAITPVDQEEEEERNCVCIYVRLFCTGTYVQLVYVCVLTLPNGACIWRRQAHGRRHTVSLMSFKASERERKKMDVSFFWQHIDKRIEPWKKKPDNRI